MLSEIEKTIADYILANQIFLPASKVLLAVSGGADSISLLHIIRSLQIDKCFDIELHCAHINHLLRGRQAQRDEDFVAAQAAILGLPVTIKRVNVRQFARKNKLSIETAARELRLKALIEIAGENNCNTIATGHQKNDNAETVIYRLLRGTGFRGLAGIWPVRTFDDIRFAHPLLCVTRNEIINYLQMKKTQWVEDQTNADCRYARNSIRHRLLPEMQKNSVDSLMEQIYKLSGSARKFQEMIEKEVRQNWSKIAVEGDVKVKLNVKLFAKVCEPVKIELIYRCLDVLGCGQGSIIQEHYQRILQLTGQHITGRKIELPGGFIVYREYDNILFSRISKEGLTVSTRQQLQTQSVILKIPGITQFNRHTVESKYLEPPFKRDFTESFPKIIEKFDFDKIKFPLVIRYRLPGDRFVPLGQPGKKKLGKFLTDHKVPNEIRQNTLVIADSEKIIWLWPIRISDEVKITSKTTKILQLKITD